MKKRFQPTLKKLYRLFLLAIMLNTTFYFAQGQDTCTRVHPGSPAPDFKTTSIDGKTTTLSELKGKVVWVNFFATWCGPCRKELPHLQNEVYLPLKNNPNFELLVIGREHRLNELAKFKQEQNLDLPFYADPNRKIFDLYASQNIPRNFIINRDGTIYRASLGFTEKEFDELVTQLKTLLKE